MSGKDRAGKAGSGKVFKMSSISDYSIGKIRQSLFNFDKMILCQFSHSDIQSLKRLFVLLSNKVLPI
jgi:hypothetical protein